MRCITSYPVPHPSESGQTAATTRPSSQPDFPRGLPRGPYSVGTRLGRLRAHVDSVASAPLHSTRRVSARRAGAARRAGGCAGKVKCRVCLGRGEAGDKRGGVGGVARRGVGAPWRRNGQPAAAAEAGEESAGAAQGGDGGCCLCVVLVVGGGYGRCPAGCAASVRPSTSAPTSLRPSFVHLPSSPAPL